MALTPGALITATIREVPNVPAYLSPVDGRLDRWIATNPNGRYSRHGDSELSDIRVVYSPSEKFAK